MALIRRFPILTLALAVCMSAALAEEPPAQTNGAGWFVGFEAGAWKPSSLGSEAPLSPKLVPGTTPFLGLVLAVPVRRQTHLMLSVGEWEQTRLPAAARVDHVRLVPVCVSFRHRLSDVSAVTPFADYGAALIFGSQRDETTATWERSRGLGVYLGAGIEFFPMHHLALFARVRYFYAKFSGTIGQTDDYSGPLLSAGLLFGF